VKFAYADPPYLGQGRRHYGHLHPDAADCDTLGWHRALIDRLSADYPDGWALSASASSLHALLPLCPPDVRIAAWCKSFCSFKPGVNPAYAWEPVIWRGGRRRGKDAPTVQDFLVCPITTRRGVSGAKPEMFTRWVLLLLGAQAEDEIDDLFPGSGSVSAEIARWRAVPSLYDLPAPALSGRAERVS
jgi:hypothetical protein